jgi:16S rRNA (guanine1516-N2)-methyltransferase
MNTLTKIKLARPDIDKFPLEIKNFISEHPQYFEDNNDAEEYLFFDDSDQRMKYHSQDNGDLFFNFEEEMNYHRKKHYALSKEPLAKALGLTQKLDRLVWDATCGTGKDALLIAYFGAQVKAFERHPLIFLLLLDAKRIFPVKVDFFFGDSLAYSHLSGIRPDTIYYDPMYPEKKKSALPRKEMQIFKTIIGPDTDSEFFLTKAKIVTLDRVVVKRPIHGTKIHEDTNATYSGKSTRYDMYKNFSPL